MSAARNLQSPQIYSRHASCRAGRIAFAVIGACFAVPSSDAGIFTSMSQYGNSKALSANPMFRWSAAVRRTDSLGMSYASAVMVAPDLFITSGHYTPRNGSLTAKLHEIVFGPNYHTSNDRHPIARTERYPAFVFGDTSTIDLGVGWTSEFVPGFEVPIRFTAVPFNTTLTVVEYGNYGDITTGELPSLGDRLAGRAWTATATGTNFNSGSYFTTRFDGPGASDPLNVGVTNYASGSPWWTSTGELVGISIASTNTYDSGFTVVLNLSNPSIQAYLAPLITDSWARYNASLVSGPQLTCAVTLAGVQLSFSNLLLAREYRVMRSPTLAGWQEAHRFTATSATDSWGDSLATEGKMFYRLEWNE